MWISPYTGFRLAETVTVHTQAQARDEGIMAFGVMRERDDSDLDRDREGH